MPTLEELFAQVDAQREEIIALEQALVRIPSVNSGFMPTGDETPVCEHIRDWLAEDGIQSEILGRTPERGNIIARIEGSNPEAGLMFMSHTDVVPVEEEEKWRFPPVQRHHRRRTHLRARRIRLQGPAHRPALRNAPARPQQHPTRRQPHPLLRRRRRARRSLRLRLAGRESSRENPRALRRQRRRRHPHRLAQRLDLPARHRRKGTPPGRNRSQGRQLPRLRPMAGHQRPLHASARPAAHRSLRA